MHTDDTFDPLLASRLDALRAGTNSLDAPARVEHALMAAFAQHHRARPWYQRFTSGQWGMAGIGSCAVAVLAFMLVLRAPPMGGVDPWALERSDSAVAFIALESLERIEQEDNPRMVETELPRTALASLGVPVTPENAGDSVRAEMLVGFDGEPLALRLISTE